MGKIRKQIVLCMFVLIVLTTGLCACGSAEQKSGTLKVGVRDDIVNFSCLNETTGKYYGLEVDIANELADRLGYADVEFTTVQPENRKEMLLNGDVDCLIALYSIADSRLENFDFSAPYYTDKTVLMVEKSTLFDSISDLKDKTIGIVNGTNAGPLLANKLYELGIITDKVVSNSDNETVYEGARVRKAERYSDLDTLLESGEVDAVCMDASIAGTYLNEDRLYLEETISEQEYGVATIKDSDLSQQVSEAIQAMLDDGTIDLLINKWD